MSSSSVRTFTLFFILIAGLAAAPGALSQPLRQPTAPEVELRTLDGETLELSDLRGEVVVLNFWATWCPPCRHEIPAFIDVQKRYADDGLRIIGISMDTAGSEHVAEFAREIGINYDLVMADADLVKRFGGIRTLPSTFFIGRDGTLLARVPGMLDEAALERHVRRALE